MLMKGFLSCTVVTVDMPKIKKLGKQSSNVHKLNVNSNVHETVLCLFLWVIYAVNILRYLKQNASSTLCLRLAAIRGIRMPWQQVLSEAARIYTKTCAHMHTSTNAHAFSFPHHILTDAWGSYQLHQHPPYWEAMNLHRIAGQTEKSWLKWEWDGK